MGLMSGLVRFAQNIVEIGRGVVSSTPPTPPQRPSVSPSFTPRPPSRNSHQQGQFFMKTNAAIHNHAPVQIPLGLRTRFSSPQGPYVVGNDGQPVYAKTGKNPGTDRPDPAEFGLYPGQRKVHDGKYVVLDDGSRQYLKGGGGAYDPSQTPGSGHSRLQ